MSSFQKRKPTPNIPGSRPSLHNGQLIVSTGNPSLDFILGGGIQIGSIILIEEDKYVTYSKSILKYFLAEGAVHKHSIFLTSLDEDPKELIKKIPVPSQDMSYGQPSQNELSAENEDMRIAWRYNALPKVDSEQKNTTIGHHFDLTKPITEDCLRELEIFCFDETQQDASDECAMFTGQIFGKIILSLKERITKINLNDNDLDEMSKKFLRICFHSLGSPLWYTENYSKDICLFLTCLKALVRCNLSACFITMPMHLLQHYDEQLVHRIRNLVDYSIELESFAGSDREANPIFKEYNGLLHIRRSIALNTLASFVPETHDLAFKLRRKKFVIEKLHLPPELQEESDQKAMQNEIIPTVSCGSSSKHLLEF